MPSVPSASRNSTGMRSTSMVRRSRSHPSLRLLEAQRGAAAELLPSCLPVRCATKDGITSFSPGVFELELESAQPGPFSSRRDRCKSYGNLAAAPEGSKLQQLLGMFASQCPVTRQIVQHLAAWRAEQAASPNASAPEGSSPPTTPTSAAAAAAAASAQDIQMLAQQLLAAGFLVQVRDEAPGDLSKSRDPRSCLQSLRHCFIVCLGHRPTSAEVQHGGEGALLLPPEPEYLEEPLVVEPRLREQFVIAHPTLAYEELLEAVPPYFVGPISQLEGVVKLLCSEMSAAFKMQGLPVPPWRTHTALRSKWSPTQLAQLSNKMAALRRNSMGPGTGSQVYSMPANSSHVELCHGARPAAGYRPARAAVGSAPVGCDSQHPQQPMPAQQQGQGRPLPAQAAPAPGSTQARGLAAASQGGSKPHAVLSAAVTFAPRAAVPISAFAGPLPEPAAAVGSAGVVSAATWAVATCGPAGASPLMHLASYPPPSEPVLHMLDLNSVAGDAAGGDGCGLRFTRKASAEWRQHVSGKKMKGLLTAAFDKVARGAGPGGADGSRAAGGNIRRSGDQPWSRITTVRWGAAYVPQP